jgi:hypothetical protein
MPLGLSTTGQTVQALALYPNERTWPATAYFSPSPDQSRSALV